MKIGAYSYRVRLANDSLTRAKNIILFDSLENFYQEADETGQTIPSDWKGTLAGIDISALTAKDIDAVVYLSGIDNMNIHGHHDLDEVLDGERVWIEYNEFKQLYGLDAAHAIAVDARKTTSHEDFVLATKESISFTVYMQAPERDTTGKTDPVTYNNIYVERTALKNSGDEITEIDQFFHQDYTQIHYRIIGNLYLKKVDETDMSSPVSGAAYLLRGTSDYGTEYELTRVSGRSGAISFTNLEKGTYELVETDCGNAWQINAEVYTVVIDEQGNTVINLPEKDGVYLVADTPRIYADISFMKQDSISGSPLNEVQFMLSGTSDYGNDVLLYAVSGSSTPGKVSFSDVEKGTYTLVETKASDGYIDQGTVWTEKVTGQGMFSIFNGDQQLDLSSSGNYEIKNEPYHEIRFLKSSTYGTNIYLEGAEFSLTGVSDYGTSTDMTAESDSNGLVVFSGLEPGTYLLKETKAPADHDLNETTYTVIVSSDGSFEIDGLGTTEFNDAEVYDFKDTKTSGMVCLIKRWADDKTNDERVIPDMTITTQRPSADPMGYTVTFDANGGTYGNNTTANKVIYNQSNAIVAGTYMEPTMNSEYVSFAGWYTKTSSGTKVEISADGIPANALNGDITLYAQWNSPPRYAVAIYGIEVDKDKSGNAMGLTFGPALGANYVNSYKSHTPTGTTASGNSHRCVHNDDWTTIILWNKKDPYVYEQCIAEGCTHSVILDASKTTSVMLANFRADYIGDGPSVLYKEIIYGPTYSYENMRWHPNNKTNGTITGGWGVSRVRAMLNGADSLTDRTSKYSIDKYAASAYTSSNCLFNAFPIELQASIGKKAITESGQDTTYDKLWLFSYGELSTGTKYQKFSGNITNASRVGYTSDTYSPTEIFWLRTTSISPSVRTVTKTGSFSTNYAKTANGIAPGFSLSR